MSLFTFAFPPGFSSQNTCASNLLILTEGESHMSGGSPAFWQACERNSFSFQFYSIGTWGSSRPDA